MQEIQDNISVKELLQHEEEWMVTELAKLKYKIRGCLIQTGVEMANKLSLDILSNAATKLRKKTPRFDRLKEGVTLNLQDVVKKNEITLSVMGSNQRKTQALRIFTGSTEADRRTTRTAKDRKGPWIGRIHPPHRTGSISNINTLDYNEIRAKLNNKIKNVI